MRLNPWYSFWRQYLELVLRAALYMFVFGVGLALVRELLEGEPLHLSMPGLAWGALLALGIFALLPVAMWGFSQLVGRTDKKAKGPATEPDK